jgi:tetratricopeptide (TPR) repeat protein
VEIDREAESYQVRGMLRAKTGRSAEAIDDFTRGLAADPRRVELLIWRSEAKLDLKDFAGAIQDHTQWIQRCSSPDEEAKHWVDWLAHVLVNRAYARIESQDFAGAESDCSHLIEASPGDLTALMNRAEARTKLGRKAEAKQDYEAVLRLEPGNGEALRLMADLDP